MSDTIKPLKNVVPPLKFGEVLQFSLEEKKAATIKASEIFEKYTEPNQKKRLVEVQSRLRKRNEIVASKMKKK